MQQAILGHFGTDFGQFGEFPASSMSIWAIWGSGAMATPERLIEQCGAGACVVAAVVRGATFVEDLLRNTLVLPNTKTIQLAKDEQVRNMTEAYSHKPLGALRVRVLRARNLAGTNWQMGNLDAFSSDPYCVLRLRWAGYVWGLSASSIDQWCRTTAPNFGHGIGLTAL